MSIQSRPKLQCAGPQTDYMLRSQHYRRCQVSAVALDLNPVMFALQQMWSSKACRQASHSSQQPWTSQRKKSTIHMLLWTLTQRAACPSSLSRKAGSRVGESGPNTLTCQNLVTWVRPMTASLPQLRCSGLPLKTDLLACLMFCQCDSDQRRLASCTHAAASVQQTTTQALCAACSHTHNTPLQHIGIVSMPCISAPVSLVLKTIGQNSSKVSLC